MTHAEEARKGQKNPKDVMENTCKAHQRRKKSRKKIRRNNRLHICEKKVYCYQPELYAFSAYSKS